MKKIRRFVNALLWLLVGGYVAVVVLLSIPTVQRFVCSQIEQGLSATLGTKVEIQAVDLSFPNRIIIDNLLIQDQAGEDMIRASRVAVKLNLLELINGRVSISSAQLFGLKANLYRTAPENPANFQFAIDSLSSSDDKEPAPLNLRISSLIVRRGQVSYNLRSDSTAVLSPNHVNLYDISSHVILNTLTDDSLNLNIKKLALKDRSGLQLRRLSGQLSVGRAGAQLSAFAIELPATEIAIPSLAATYRLDGRKLRPESLILSGELQAQRITPSDFAALIPALSGYSSSLALNTKVEGKGRRLGAEISLQQEADLSLRAEAEATDFIDGEMAWRLRVGELTTSVEGIRSIMNNIDSGASLPELLYPLGQISAQALVSGKGNDVSAQATLTTEAGEAEICLDKKSNHATLIAETEELNLAPLFPDSGLGSIALALNASATLNADLDLSTLSAEAEIKHLAFKNHNYKNIYASADLSDGGRNINCRAQLDDELGCVGLEAAVTGLNDNPLLALSATVANLSPNAMGLTDRWPGARFDFQLSGEYQGRDLNSANAHVTIDHFAMSSPEIDYHFNTFALNKSYDQGHQRLYAKSDFLQLRLEGDFDYATLGSSVATAVHHRLPTMPGLENTTNLGNRFQLYSTLENAGFLRHVLGLPIIINEPAHVIADIDDNNRQFYFNLDASDFSYNSTRYTGSYAVVSSPSDSLKARMAISIPGAAGQSRIELQANAFDNHLASALHFSTNGAHSIHGSLYTDSEFLKNQEGKSEARIAILPSMVHVADTIWSIAPSVINYSDKRLEIGHFAVRHADQHVIIDGTATDNPWDGIEVSLKDVDVSYILELVGFDSVEFGGYASGRVKARSLFADPQAEAHLNVRNFSFETGYMGQLVADADWNLDQGAINIDATVFDDGLHITAIKGYVSPKNNDIDLMVHADGTRVDFIKNYTSSFLDRIRLRAWGDVNVVGPLSAIQLVGDAYVKGDFFLTPLNTAYTLQGGQVHLVPDNIQLLNDTIVDNRGGVGVVNGDLPHRHLGHFTFDINAEAENLLAFDTQPTADDTFWGTVYATGDCRVHEVGDDVVIDVNVTPESGTEIVYNAASPDAIANHDFIRYTDSSASSPQWETEFSANSSDLGIPAQPGEYPDYPDETRNRGNDGGLYINFLIHSNPNATLKVLMDQRNGDYIALHGRGALNATYYSKGSFDLFGNYTVNDGTYTLSVQNILKREFEFLPGGTIAFGGDAYNAALNLQAQYTLNSVPLSDINIGRSFTNNNVRVDCIMNISGTPGSPRVDFTIDIPTVSTDAKQMIMSLMNSEEETNQQALYLLAVGRFLNQNNNSSYSDASRQSQTSLAMQSIISGTISQQISSILGSVVRTNNWNFGANISTGDEGFNNAEYEGLVSGRMFNNRLLFDGQFGYRDNINATSSFIGDFDIRYLLVPNGNASVKVYNQTNDKYFTKNSLNTQGIALILKRDFNYLYELLPWKRHRFSIAETDTLQTIKNK